MSLAVVVSEAVFARKLSDMGLQGDLGAAMARKGWNTYGDFCFSSTFAPGAPADPEKLIKDIIVPLLGEDEEAEIFKHKPKLLRLHFES